MYPQVAVVVVETPIKLVEAEGNGVVSGLNTRGRLNQDSLGISLPASWLRSPLGLF